MCLTSALLHWEMVSTMMMAYDDISHQTELEQKESNKFITMKESCNKKCYDITCSYIWFSNVPCVSKNIPPLTCYNLYIHSSIATIFGTNVAEKVGNQNILYFPTSVN